MVPLSLLLEEDGLELVQVVEDQDAIFLHVRTTKPTAACPVCQAPASRIRSRYLRSPADLPLVGKRLILQLTLRKFHCENENCPRRIFCERMPGVVAAYARTTIRLNQAHLGMALAVGGEGGSRLAHLLGMPISGDTLLRRIHSTPLPEQQPVQVLGVDDWAYRRGRTYGTILCDLERRCPVDLLPDRTSESLSSWLKERPEIRVVSRDRASEYSQAATEGAPQATQVADRWHLLKNLRDALKRLADRSYGAVRTAAETIAATSRRPSDTESPAHTETPPEICEPTVTSPSLENQIGLSKWQTLYQQVVKLDQQQISQREIARRTGLDRGTVARYLKAGTFPERRTGTSPGPKSSLGNEHRSHLKRRWEEGCRNASQLYQEVKAQGFRGSYYSVRRAVAKWRNAASPCQSVPAWKPPCSSSVAWLLFRGQDELAETDRKFVEELQNQCPSIKQAAELGQEFVEMVHHRQMENWPGWLDRATHPNTPKEIRNFALGLKSDEEAVKAALSLEWSNGQVEGQVNRLKTLKRQMYGRASFALLRKRVLLAA
ncbi:MAG: ISL3 family transposase [Planctomycetaceae bacterium]|nr:ISL3 family transposase [Planctomycetaceae bacterium]